MPPGVCSSAANPRGEQTSPTFTPSDEALLLAIWRRFASTYTPLCGLDYASTLSSHLNARLPSSRPRFSPRAVLSKISDLRHRYCDVLYRSLVGEVSRGTEPFHFEHFHALQQIFACSKSARNNPHMRPPYNPQSHHSPVFNPTNLPLRRQPPFLAYPRVPPLPTPNPPLPFSFPSSNQQKRPQLPPPPPLPPPLPPVIQNAPSMPQRRLAKLAPRPQSAQQPVKSRSDSLPTTSSRKSQGANPPERNGNPVQVHKTMMHRSMRPPGIARSIASPLSLKQFQRKRPKMAKVQNPNSPPFTRPLSMPQKRQRSDVQQPSNDTNPKRKLPAFQPRSRGVAGSDCTNRPSVGWRAMLAREREELSEQVQMGLPIDEGSIRENSGFGHKVQSGMVEEKRAGNGIEKPQRVHKNAESDVVKGKTDVVPVQGKDVSGRKGDAVEKRIATPKQVTASKQPVAVRPKEKIAGAIEKSSSEKSIGKKASRALTQSKPKEKIIAKPAKDGSGLVAHVVPVKTRAHRAIVTARGASKRKSSSLDCEASMETRSHHSEALSKAKVKSSVAKPSPQPSAKKQQKSLETEKSAPPVESIEVDLECSESLPAQPVAMQPEQENAPTPQALTTSKRVTRSMTNAARSIREAERRVSLSGNKRKRNEEREEEEEEVHSNEDDGNESDDSILPFIDLDWLTYKPGILPEEEELERGKSEITTEPSHDCTSSAGMVHVVEDVSCKEERKKQRKASRIS